MYKTREDRVAGQVGRLKISLDNGFSGSFRPLTQEPVDIRTEEVGWEAVEYERGVQSVGRPR